MDCSGISITDEGKKEINKITIYRKPGINLRKNEWNKFLEQFNNTETIITGDFNAHNREWNCRRTDNNGAVLSDILWENDMYVINEDTLSYLGDMYHSSSNIDLIFASESLVNSMKYEQVTDTWGSDHYPIKVQLNRNMGTYQKRTNKTSTKKTPRSKYEELMEEKINEIKEEEINENNVI